MLGCVSQHPRSVRRKPNFTAFLLTGGLAGLVIGLCVSVAGRVDARYDASVALGFLGLIGAGLGILVGGAIAVVLDRRP